MNSSEVMPPRLAEIVEDFRISEGSEKLELLLQFAENLPPLPDRLQGHQDQMESVPECMTPVSVTAELNDGGLEYYFVVPEESPTVRGFATILADGLHGAAPDQVLRISPNFYLQMGLQSVLSMQRLNGMASMVAHVKRLALEKMSQA